MQLALGTVQFGLAYGVAGPGCPVSPDETRRILARAHDLGIRTLDTAATYGDIEERLAGLCGDYDFTIVSKIRPVPAALTPAEKRAFVVAEAERARMRLGRHLCALLVHRADDLVETDGDDVWAALSAWGSDHGITVGASCYDPVMAERLSALEGFGIAQVPGNALDQRIAQLWPGRTGFDLHLRSAFLQGLLLLPAASAAKRLPQAATALVRWHAFCRDRGLSPIAAALSIVKSFPAVACVVVGVDSLSQLEEIAAAWEAAKPLLAPELACSDRDVIDPRRWIVR